MGEIISGHAFYSRKTKPGDYEHEQADVRLDFNVTEGETCDSILAVASATAKAKVHELLGLTKKATTLPAQLQGTSGGAPPASGKEALVAAAAAAAGAPKSGTAEAAPAKTKAAKPPKAAPAAEPIKEPEPQANADDDLADLLGAAPEEITDADLVSKTTSTNARIKNPQAIKAVIGKYVEFPKGVKDIPPALRPGYIAELEKLQPAG